MPRRCLDDKARRTALSLLARGMGSPGDIAGLAGVPTQRVEQWARRAGVDWARIKRSVLAKAWRVEMGLERHGMGKAKLRVLGKRAKAEWDAHHGNGQAPSDADHGEVSGLPPQRDDLDQA